MRGQKYELPIEWECAINDWCNYLTAAGHSPETRRTRRGAVRYIARESGTTHPREITAEWLVSHCGAQDWSTDHRRTIRTSLRIFYEWGIRLKLCDTNPAEELPKAAMSRPKPKPVIDSVWEELLATAAPRERLMARLAGQAGLRRGEVARIHRDDILDDVNGISLIVHGKGARQRVVPIIPVVAGELLAYQSGYTPRGFLFPGQTDGHISPAHVGAIVGKLMPPGWTMHKLRHRFASRGYAGTRDLAGVQAALGHASLQTTQRYVATTEDNVRAVAESAA